MINVKKIAKLARIKLNPGDEERYVRDLENILKAFEKLQKVPTEDIEPLITPTQIAPHWREDSSTSWQGRERALQLAPDKSGNLLRVPPVI